LWRYLVDVGDPELGLPQCPALSGHCLFLRVVPLLPDTVACRHGPRVSAWANLGLGLAVDVARVETAGVKACFFPGTFEGVVGEVTPGCPDFIDGTPMIEPAILGTPPALWLLEVLNWPLPLQRIVRTLGEQHMDVGLFLALLIAGAMHHPQIRMVLEMGRKELSGHLDICFMG